MTKLVFIIGTLIAFLAVASVAGAGEALRATLTGDQEVPPVATDATGKFRIKFNKQQTEAEYTLRVNDGVRVTQAHLHCAPAGVNGPIIIFLAGFHNLGWDVDGKWVSNATVTDANITNTACGMTLSAIAQAMRDGNVYANVHSVANPGGVIRGQVERADDDD
jgi:hypothetical protein